MRKLSIGIALLLFAACTSDEVTPAPDQPARRSAPSVHNPDPEAERGANTYVVWTRGGIEDGVAGRLASAKGVHIVSEVVGGVVWLDTETDFDIPLDVVFVERDRLIARQIGFEPFALLDDETFLMSATGETLREIVPGEKLDIAGTRREMAGSIADVAAMGYEAIAAGPPPEGWGRRFLLVRHSGSRRELRSAIRPLLDRGVRFRTHTSDDTVFLRQADAVEPLMFFKETFGEFGARPVGGNLEVDPRWKDEHIASRSVPLLGDVTCHRKTIRMLRAAMNEIVRAGLSGEIRREEFAGCYSPRFIGSDPSAPLSAHAFGAAVDINAASNPQGSEPVMSREIVELMRSNGFTWGGRWLLPDGMHFEWATRRRLNLEANREV